MIFILLQIFEYLNTNININDGIYGSLFYIITGTHGFHVMIGLIYIYVSYIRIKLNHFNDIHHTSINDSNLYFHFVDIV